MTQEQLGLGFEPAHEGLPSAPPRKKRTAKPVVSPTPLPVASGVSPAPADLTPAAMAEALESHPDYRVLRRLVPALHFDRPPQGPVRTLLVLDTETTGLEAAKEKVIELALLRVAVDIATGLPVGPVQVYDGLEDPGRAIPPAITDITGITDAMVHGQRLDEALIAQLIVGVDLVVAHNAGFDRPFVEARLPEFARLPWACSFADLDWKALGQSSAKLENLALACGWFYDAHRAETDCHALLAVLAQPQARFGHASTTEGAEAGATGLSVLLAAADQTHHRLQATGAPFEAKDALKARGYRWDGQQRVWGTTLRSERALADELTWLADAVYSGPTRVRVETLTAQQRYSARGGAPTMRALGANPLGF